MLIHWMSLQELRPTMKLRLVIQLTYEKQMYRSSCLHVYEVIDIKSSRQSQTSTVTVKN